MLKGTFRVCMRKKAELKEWKGKLVDVEFALSAAHDKIKEIEKVYDALQRENKKTRENAKKSKIQH